MKKVVITGPTGTIGIALIEKCIQKKIEVLAICRKNSHNIKNIPQSNLVKIIECDLSEYSTLEIHEKYDAFYHFAWDGTIGDDRNNLFLQNKNVQYTLEAVNLAKKIGCQTFVGAGSQAEYGLVSGKISPNTKTNPTTGYGIAKLCAGQMSKLLCDNLQMQHIWMRVLSIYGPYDDKNTMVTSTISKMLNNELTCFTKAEQEWDYLYSADAAEAFYLVGKMSKKSAVYCLGSGEAKPLKDYIRIIKETVNPTAEVRIGAIPYSENQIMYLCANIEPLKEDIGFEPKITFKQGVELLLKNDFGGYENE